MGAANAGATVVWLLPIAQSIKQNGHETGRSQSNRCIADLR
jgi:hypothetical protein